MSKNKEIRCEKEKTEEEAVKEEEDRGCSFGAVLAKCLQGPGSNFWNHRKEAGLGWI